MNDRTMKVVQRLPRQTAYRYHGGPGCDEFFSNLLGDDWLGQFTPAPIPEDTPLPDLGVPVAGADEVPGEDATGSATTVPATNEETEAGGSGLSDDSVPLPAKVRGWYQSELTLLPGGVVMILGNIINVFTAEQFANEWEEVA